MTYCLLALALWFPAQEGAVFRASLLDGTTVEGPLTEISGEAASLQVAGEARTVAASGLRSLAAVQPPQETPPAAILVELADGSQLRAEEFTLAGGKARVGTAAGAVLELSTRQIRAVLLKSLEDGPELLRQWEEIRTAPAPADLLVFRRGEGAEAQLDRLEGVILEVTDEKVDFEFDGNRTAANRAKVDGLRFVQVPETQLPPEVCQVVDLAGGRWRVQRLALADQALQLTTLGGVDARLPLDRIRQVDFAAVNIVYLSDLEWADSKFTPYIPSRLEPWFAPRRDKGFQGPLQIQGQRFEKGLALHSRTELTYRLQEDYQRFRAIAGIDDQARSGDSKAHVVLTISGDGKTLFTSEVSGVMDPIELDIDISGVKRLSILVDYGRDIDIADHLDLGEARLIK